MESCVIGLDFGTDSVRGVLVGTDSLQLLAEAVAYYPRWNNRFYCEPQLSRFRQHPLDYIESVEKVLLELTSLQPDRKSMIKSISLATTGSTPCLVDKEGVPLSLTEKHKENPNAMFVLWKDHSAIQEAEEINDKLVNNPINYSKYSGGNYSSEWFWSKALHLLRVDERLREDAYGVVEHCDWMVSYLIGKTKIEEMKLSRCSAGHKAMWHEEWEGFPSADFLYELDPQLADFVKRMSKQTYTSDCVAGTLSADWRRKLGLTQSVLVGVGNTDAHAGAVGAGIKSGTLVQNMGTSTCSMVVMPYNKMKHFVVEGICGQVDGSILPGQIGLEAGMSAFGDVFAWYQKVISQTTEKLIEKSSFLSSAQKENLIKEIKENILIELTNEIETHPDRIPSCYATDWLNGRRTPYTNYQLTGSLSGLTLGTDANDIYYAFVEATVFGIKAIVNHFKKNEIDIEKVVAIGGIPFKSNLVMQLLADSLQIPIEVPDCKQACALGSAIFATVIAKIFPTVEVAQEVFKRPIVKVFKPNERRASLLKKRYKHYQKLGRLQEKLLE